MSGDTDPLINWPAHPMTDTDEYMSQADWDEFRELVADIVNVARSATANAVTALTSLTIALVGGVVTVSSSDFSKALWSEATNPADFRAVLWRSLIFTLAGAGLAALTMMVPLMVEAVFAMSSATRLHRLYDQSRRTPLTPKKNIWPQEISRVSISVHWKITLPLILFAAGMGTTGIYIWRETWR
jgi:hypothetical protein